MFDEFLRGDGFNMIQWDLGWNFSSFLEHSHWLMKFKGGCEASVREIFRITDPQNFFETTNSPGETGQKGWDDCKSYCKNWVLVSFLYETVFSTRLVVQLSRLTATSLQDVQHLKLRNVTFFAILPFILGYCVSERKKAWHFGSKTT